jgi:flagellar biosynthesis protein FlhF
MKIKKFQAPNFREALARVKKEMGEEAIILSSEEIPGLRAKVEVVAAVDQDPIGEKNPYADPRSDPMEMGTESQEKADRVSLSDTSHSGYRDDFLPSDPILKELMNLRQSIEALREKGYEVSLPEGKKNIYRYLKTRSIRDELALELTEKAGNLEEIPELILNNLRIGWDLPERRVIVLLGSTGVGKTTTAAKLCGQAIKQNKKVGLISLDTFRIGAIEQVRIYSRILGVPLFVAASPEEVRTGVQKLQDRDIILVDTTGRNPRDHSYIEELKKLYGLGIPVETHLLLSGSSSEHFMVDSYKQYSRLPLDWISFTKMDEAGGFGALYNFSVQVRKPIAYLTNGQKVPNDIAFYTGRELVDLILNSQNPDTPGPAGPMN